MSKPTFRKAALNALSSPEELNKILVVTKPAGWIALVGIIIVVVAALLWGFFGSIPTVVEARGILVREGGLHNITALGNGVLSDVRALEEDFVDVGDTIAIIDLPDLALKLENAYDAVRETDSIYQKTLASINQARSLRTSTTSSRLDARKLKTKAAQERLDNQIRQSDATKELLEKGLVTRTEYLSSRESVLQAQQDLISIRTTELQERSSDNETSYQNQQELIRAENQLATAVRAAKELELQYKTSSVVRSNTTGYIKQFSASVGSIITPGTTIAIVESNHHQDIHLGRGNRLAVAVFVPPALGKKITRGMTVNVVPTNVEAEDYGSIISTASYVSEYPLDAAGVRRYISNDALANFFGVSQEPPIGIVALLKVDSQNPSGYAWTSGRGPKVRITSGSICNCSIIVDSRPPITLLLPWLKQKLGI